MKTLLLCALAGGALLFACNGEDIDAGTSDASTPDAAEEGATAGDASAPGDGSSSTGVVEIGRGCKATSDCANGLECLDFAVHKDGGCSIVAKQCSKRCEPSDQKSCAELGAKVLCFAGCDGEGTCGRTQ